MSKKIIATLGPSSLSKDIVKKMDALGVDHFRINLSHTKIDTIKETVNILRNWTKKSICLDIEGAQLRTGKIKGGSQYLDTASIIKFSGDKAGLKSNNILLNLPNPEKILYVGDLLKIDFNSALVQITGIKGKLITTRVIKGGMIGSNKGISIDRQITLPRFSNKDYSAFDISKKLGLKTFFLSFCSTENDVIALRELFDYPINVISKIENESGLINLVPICQESDAILIDRGDLSRDVSLTKIACAQSYILDIAKNMNVSVYVATNLVESMVQNPEPNRAEINDIVHTLQSGADGLVLAAESAIGAYPIECVKVLSKIINEIKNKPQQIKSDYLLNQEYVNLIPPHGGQLVQQIIYDNEKDIDLDNLKMIKVNTRIESDILQITNGVYSPLNRFMNYDELKLVLNNNRLRDESYWTMPILFQSNVGKKFRLIKNQRIGLISEKSNRLFAFLDVEKVEKIKDIEKISKDWFGTEDLEHPGVDQFVRSGNYIISGRPFLIESNKPFTIPSYELTPHQTRSLFDLYQWENIIGFHTRNVPHRAHEYIQKKALIDTNADAIFISPVTGEKKSGDFMSEPIIECYNTIIKEGIYKPYGAIIGTFNTYSRYCGPREAVFTAICRKNYGCNYFIVGRDHTGVGDFYSSNASKQIFEEIDLGMNIIAFENAYYSQKRKKIILGYNNGNIIRKADKEISGTVIRNLLLSGENIPQYLIRKQLSQYLYKLYNKTPKKIFEE